MYLLYHIYPFLAIIVYINLTYSFFCVIIICSNFFAINNLRRTCYENPRKLQSSDRGWSDEMRLQARTRSLPCHPEWHPCSSGLAEPCAYWTWSFSWPERNPARTGRCVQQLLQSWSRVRAQSWTRCRLLRKCPWNFRGLFIINKLN